MPLCGRATLNCREHMADEAEAEDVSIIDAVSADEDGRLIELRVHFRQERTLSLEASGFERGIQESIASIVKSIDSVGRRIVTAWPKHFEVFPLIGLLLLSENLLVLMQRAPLG